MPEIIYDFNDAVKFIKDTTALDEETIIKVLDAEEGYMRKIGIMESVQKKNTRRRLTWAFNER